MMMYLLLLCSPRRAFNEFRSTFFVQKTNLLHLPADITTEILSRLPIESVIQCKRVCKTWRSLIDGPAFGEAHTRYHMLQLDHSSSSNSAVTSMFFLLTKLQQPIPPRYTLTYEFHCGNYINTNTNADDNDNQIGGGLKISKPPNTTISDIDFMYWKIVGSTNGLICLSGSKGVYVYNPFTSEYVNLGHPRFKTSPNHGHYNLYGKGFGYHPSTNEYKVVFIYYTLKEEETGIKQHVGEVSVYTLGSGTWRTIEEEALSHTHRRLSCSTPGVLMNGALHWLRTTMDGKYHEIVSFDLAEEKFMSNIIRPSAPAAAQSEPNYSAVGTYFQLGLLGGCLCITQHNENSSYIWVMNNRDKPWTRKCMITQKDDWRKINRKQNFLFHNGTNLGSYDPIALLGNGSKILLWGRETMAIVLYDIETGDIDYDIMSDGYQYLSDDILHIKYAAIPYVRSIVSLKALGEEGAKKT